MSPANIHPPIDAINPLLRQETAAKGFSRGKRDTWVCGGARLNLAPGDGYEDTGLLVV
jgi:hypothetical protein